MRPFRLLLAVMFAVTLPASTRWCAAQAPPTLEGTYSGVLQAGEAQLHIVLHLSQNSAGALHATLDSLENAVFAVEASSASLNAGTLKLEIRTVGVSYEGRVSVDRQTIDGDWKQGSASLPLVFHRDSPAHQPEGAKFAVEGLWQGALEVNGLRLRFQLHVSHDHQGQLIAALDSLDQFVSGLPAAKVTEKDNAFHFEIPALASTYDGTLDVTKSLIDGKWSQSELTQKLDFRRSDQPLELRRPQNPVKPYPYREEDITFLNARAGVKLAGTLTVPNGTGPFPAAILIAGSGPQDRDGSIANHKPFLVLADYLTRKGFAVLRYDKRGVGESTGSSETATTLDLASDAECAITYLKSRKEIDPARIGLIGHSEGAMIAPAIAATSHDLPWIVLLAAPATKGEDTLLNQSDLIARAGGLSDAQVLASLNFDKQAYELLEKELDSAVVTDKLKALVKESGLDTAFPQSALDAQLHMMTTPWFRFFLTYDPMPDLKKVKCPVLALYGEKDLQVPPKINLPMLQKAFAESGNSRAELRQLPELNHLFQHAYTGSPTEYAAIDETFAPQALQVVGDWLLARNGTK
ncbi:MAG TPA: alpha/beta hydrolase [Candidatus Eremiobacteraceae bacterium]|nr:alpha/beta hydrolase [Candidatus Eremiobacteraceae bacterium]